MINIRELMEGMWRESAVKPNVMYVRPLRVCRTYKGRRYVYRAGLDRYIRLLRAR